MKYLNFILTIIAILLAGIGFHLYGLKLILVNQNSNTINIINSNQGVIASNQHLEVSVTDLRKQIETIGKELIRK